MKKSTLRKHVESLDKEYEGLFVDGKLIEGKEQRRAEIVREIKDLIQDKRCYKTFHTVNSWNSTSWKNEQPKKGFEDIWKLYEF